MPVPAFLLGATLIFWGWMTDRIWVGLGCALLIEGARRSRIRWDFTETAYVRAWRFTILAVVLAATLVLIESPGDPRAMSRVFTWLPVILLPLQFVQSYGRSTLMTLGTFSVLVRRRRAHAEKYGLPFREVRFSFSRVYLAAILISSSLGWRASVSGLYFPMLVGLIGWALIAGLRFSWALLPLSLTLSLMPAAIGASAGQKGLSALYSRLIRTSMGTSRNIGDRSRDTSMGDLGQLKQSSEILWRLKPVHGQLPRLIRLSSYSNYLDGLWRYIDLPPEVSSLEKDFDRGQLKSVQNPDNLTDEKDAFFYTPASDKPNDLIQPSLGRFHLIGSLPTKGLLPLPGGTTSFHGIGLFTDFQINAMGAVRLDSVQPVVDTDVLWSDLLTPEQAPWPRERNFKQGRNQHAAGTLPDLDLPYEESETIRNIASRLDLSSGTLDEKIEKLRAFFTSEYSYSLYNQTPLLRQGGETLLGTFLNKTHRGHCEFFASATTLLLREAKVPARYASGFAVVEFNSKLKQAMVRGTHAHAWCRAWDDTKNTWVDVDLTPRDWTRLEPIQPPPFQGIRDWYLMMKEAFILWRGKPGHMTLVTVIILSPVVIGLLFVGRKLWQSRQNVGQGDAIRRGATTVVTPLSQLEKPARSVLGPRPQGQPLAAWLAGFQELLEAPEMLSEALSLHQQLRFDPAAAGGSLEERLKELSRHLRESIAGLPKQRSVR